MGIKFYDNEENNCNTPLNPPYGLSLPKGLSKGGNHIKCRYCIFAINREYGSRDVRSGPWGEIINCTNDFISRSDILYSDIWWGCEEYKEII